MAHDPTRAAWRMAVSFIESERGKAWVVEFTNDKSTFPLRLSQNTSPVPIDVQLKIEELISLIEERQKGND